MPAGKLIVISAPSGSGKTTIAHEVMRRNPTLAFSVSATTRSKRNEEADGRDYFFLTREQFERRVAAGEFVEWEEIYGDLYGTLKGQVDEALRNGRHILFDVDVKGGLSIKKAYPESLTIFIRPPSVEVLKQRLMNRKTEEEAALARRMERVPMELAMGGRFDHQVVNDELSRAVDEVNGFVVNYLEA